MRDCIGLMEKMFRDLAGGKILQPLRSLMWLPDRRGLLGIMPGYAQGPNIAGIKLITIFHGNSAAGYPSHQGLVILFDATHGTPLAILDAQEITAIRTAAVSALATRLLAREDATTLAILGTGEQAVRHIEAVSLVRQIREVKVWGRNCAHAYALRDRMGTRYPIEVAGSAVAAVEGADIVCTVTAAPQPVLQGDWIAAGAHVNVVGACTPSTREVDTAAMVRSRIFTDRYESLFTEAGEFIIPFREGRVAESDVRGEIGEVLTGVKKGRTGPEEVTIFKSLGIAAEDLYAAWQVYGAAKEEGEG